MHNLSILALEGFVAFDLSIPADIFNRACDRTGKKLYNTTVCSNTKQVCGSLFDITAIQGLNSLQEANTIIIPGIINMEAPATDDVLNALHAAAARGARIASICTGAFVLAKAGLLNGLQATTHWRATTILQKHYPLIKVVPNVLFIDNGSILTSAGVAAGVDLCLHMLRKDYGADIAAASAAEIVMPPERSGAQLQLVKHEVPDSGSGINDIMLWLQENLGRKLSVAATAKKFNMCTRTLNRRFTEQAGITPLQWILKARILRAQQVLETTSLSIEGVATVCGFESAAVFRERFKRVVGVTPTAWRATYRAE